MFALPSLARAALALLLTLAVVAVVLLLGSKATSPARFHREVSRICAAVGAQFVARTTVDGVAALHPRGLSAIERDAVAYFTLNQRLSALSAPTAQAPVWHTFLSELGRGQATLQAMASAAQAGEPSQLRALERTAGPAVNEPFAYASAQRLGCASG
jgi:hypothetical protein